MFLSSDHFHGLVSCTVFTVSPLVQSWLVECGCVGGFDKIGGRGGVGTHVRLRVCGLYHAHNVIVAGTQIIYLCFCKYANAIIL